MKVEQLMTRTVHACHPEDSLNVAADIMWKQDCGCVPVVVDEEGGARVAGMITDRDVCMAAYTQGRPLAAMTVASAMSREVCSCRSTDSIRTALDILRTKQIHRLPVVDANDHLVGVLSLADLAREAAREHGRRTSAVKDGDIAETIETIARSRSQGEVVCAA